MKRPDKAKRDLTSRWLEKAAKDVAVGKLLFDKGETFLILPAFIVSNV
jgi:hypothetical protein